MKKFSHVLITFLIVSYSIFSCDVFSPKKSKTVMGIDNEKPQIKSSPVLNANLASEQELIDLGLKTDLISKILNNRPFLSMIELDTLIIDVSKEDLYTKLFVPFNLNLTKEENFKMIPGVGDKMAHEFDEYRPYVSVKQFKREIGKYVDQNEVSRYLNYVFVPVELNSSTEGDIKSLPGVGNKITHEFIEYRPYQSIKQFRREIGKYVDDDELMRLERFVYLKDQ